MPGDPVQDAEKFVRYFQRLVESEGDSWQLHLDVARLWLTIIQSEITAGRAAFVAMARELNESSDRGTAFDEMVHLMRRWQEP